jgi:hypothetical protein
LDSAGLRRLWLVDTAFGAGSDDLLDTVGRLENFISRGARAPASTDALVAQLFYPPPLFRRPIVPAARAGSVKSRPPIAGGRRRKLLGPPRQLNRRGVPMSRSAEEKLACTPVSDETECETRWSRRRCLAILLLGGACLWALAAAVLFG